MLNSSMDTIGYGSGNVQSGVDVTAPGVNARADVPDNYSSAPTVVDKGAFDEGKQAYADQIKKEETAKLDAEKQDRYAPLLLAMQTALAKGSTLAGDYRTNALGEADKSYALAMDNATRQQSVLARRAAEQAARMGGSAGGGMQQAGSAQAALSGQGLQNQAGLDASQMRTAAWRDAAALEKASIDQQYGHATRLYENARTDDERAAARDFAAQMQIRKDNLDLFFRQLETSGGVENPEELYKTIFGEV
jgi:hypothetical protein